MKIKLKKRKKKGTVEEWIEQIPYIVLTVAVIAIIYVLINMLINLDIDMKPVQVEITHHRILYSPNSISYQDPVSGVVYPGVIDLNKVTNETLDLLITHTYEKQISARIGIFLLKGMTIWQEPEKVAYLNKKWFERLEPLAEAKILGQASATKYTKITPVVVLKDGKRLQGWMKEEYVIPN